MLNRLFAGLMLSLLTIALVGACAPAMSASKSRSDALIQSGNIPPAQELRVAEYLNYYKQDLPAPVNTSVGLDTRPGNPQIPTGGGDVWLQIGLRARDADTHGIAPLNLALVIDRSGSMNTPDKMPYLVKALGVFLHSLAPNDMVSIVTYSDNAELLVPTREVGDGRWIEATVERIVPSGATNLHDGLQIGLAEVARNFDVRRNNRVILMTDGIANRSITDPNQIAEMAKQYNDRGIYLATIGLGLELNDALLSQLATQGKGGYHFVGSAQDMDKIFRQEVAGLIQKVATDVRVTLVLANGVRVLEITGYEGAPPAGNLTIKLQEMGTGDTQIVLAHLSVPPGVSGPRPLAKVELRYMNLIAQRNESVRQFVNVEGTSDASPDALADVQVMRNVTIQRTAQGLKEIDALYRAQRYQEAWNLAFQLEQNLLNAAQVTGEAQLRKDAELMRQYQNTLAPWIQRQTGSMPRALPTEGGAPRLERRATFTPASTEIQIK